MKPPRLRIVWVMILVAFAALEFAAIRAVIDLGGPTNYLLGLGAMPMANILVAGSLVGRRCLGGRAFLVGFEVFGAIALASYVVSATAFAREWVIPYISLMHTPLMAHIDSSISMPLPFYAVVYYLVLAVLLGLPLLGCALIGGFLCRGLAGRRSSPFSPPSHRTGSENELRPHSLPPESGQAEDREIPGIAVDARRLG
jgi:hypothetical protein